MAKTVGELIELLQEYDPSQEVVVDVESGFFDISGAEKSDAYVVLKLSDGAEEEEGEVV